MTIVYLDQKDWIFLSRGFYNPSLEPNHELSNIVLKAAANGVVFPLSLSHFEETLSHGNKERRERLVTYMIKISRGYSIAPFPTIIKAEIYNAVLKKINRPMKDLQKIVIRKGISGMLGAKGYLEYGPTFPMELREKLSEYIDSPEALLKLMTLPEVAAECKRIKQENFETLQKMEAVRLKSLAIMDNDRRYNSCMMGFIRDVILPNVLEISNKLGLPVETIVGRNEKEAKDFFQTIPTAFCLFTLCQTRDQDMSRPIKETDLYDTYALSIAIPYCGIVIADAMFWSLARQAKLHLLYNTILLDSVVDLKKYL